MASIVYNKETKGKWRVRYEDEKGEHEVFCNTHAEAQTLANIETEYLLKKYEHYKV